MSWRKRWVPRYVLFGAAGGLWSLFLLGRMYGHHGQGWLAHALEAGGMHWMGTLFLITTAFFIVDIVTGFGYLFRSKVSIIRTGALIAGIGLAVLATVQGLRSPVVTMYDVPLKGLPLALTGMRLAVVSDLHVGDMISAEWLRGRVKQIKALTPDMIVLVGDLFEGHGEPDPGLVDVLKQLSAPLGVFAVRGNHERFRSDRADTAKELLTQAAKPLAKNDTTPNKLT